MIYTITHKTTYSYEVPVGFARCVLRLTPASLNGQRLLDGHVTVLPAPSRIAEGRGAFGAKTHTLVIDQLHDTLVIEARSRVEVNARSVDTSGPAWEAVRVAAFGSHLLDEQGPAAFLYPTRRTPAAAPMTEYARQSFAPNRPIIAAMGEMMARMHADFRYDPTATTVTTPALQAFEARHGVCQDFAHIMIAGLRGLGLPAAYVSGYLRTNPPPGQARMAGADATHAWVSVWCGSDGWVGFDPTNAVLAQADHIILAAGRDYSDVAPIDGIILAHGDQTLKVEVDVVPDTEAAPDCLTAPGV